MHKYDIIEQNINAIFDKVIRNTNERYNKLGISICETQKKCESLMDKIIDWNRELRVPDKDEVEFNDSAIESIIDLMEQE